MNFRVSWLGRVVEPLVVLFVAAFAVSCCCAGGLDDDDIDLNLDGNGGQNLPPVAALTATPATGLAPLDTVLDASGSTDSDGTIVQYDWDFESDGVYDVTDGAVSENHTYPLGNYTATVRVTDNDGATDTATVDVQAVAEGELVPPVAALSGTPAGAGLTTANFDASGSTDADGTIEQYDWDFDNDGTYDLTDSGATQNHDYGAFGTYTATVRVTDNDGLTDTASATVTLSEVVITNNPPVAALAPTPTSGDAPLDVTWDASGSTDSDGTIVSYDWDMDNDGTFEIANGGTSQAVNYAAAGSYTVGVRVTDDDGATDTATASVTVNEPAVNNPPVADLVPSPTAGNAPLDVTWDASGSTDSDGTIVQYDWDMDNDGTFEITNGGATQAVNYAAAGTFTVGVRVTDDDGATDTATADVVVSVVGNLPPDAALAPTPSSGDAPLDVTWDASGSADPDGTIVQFDWDMDNDGTFEITDGGATQAANYSLPGTYTVGVQVTDDDGATDSTTADVTVLEPGNLPPTANLIPNPSFGGAPLDVTWDASGSTDADGTIVQYDWDMDNDGTFEITDGGTTQPATYPLPGTYTVGVQVTDDGGATDSTTANVTVVEAANIPPTAILLLNPDTGEAPLMVELDASTSFDPDGTIVMYDYDIDGNGSYETLNAGPTITFNYTIPGEYDVWVRVTDNDGATGEGSAHLTVTSGPTPPFAMILTTPDPPIIYGESNDIDFDGSTSFDPDGTVVRYDWDFDGDGSYDVIDGSAFQNHVYVLQPGENSHQWFAGLRVFDNDGLEGTAQVRVTLNRFPPG